MIKDRLLRFIAMENISSTQFADSIGVQRSTVSHLLAGRNNPSYDFIVKTLNHYKYLSADWLLCGIGNMYRQKDNSMNDLFSMPAASAPLPVTGAQPARSEQSTALQTGAKHIEAMRSVEPESVAAQADAAVSATESRALFPAEGSHASVSVESDSSQINGESTTKQMLVSGVNVGAAASSRGKSIQRIVIFYADHSMDVYDA